MEHCLKNGARCLAKFVSDRELAAKPITVNTARGLIELAITESGLISVNMGKPILDIEALPYKIPPLLMRRKRCFPKYTKKVFLNSD